MKIDSAIKAFSEKYDREAIESIDRISNDYALCISDSTIKAFNLTESFDTFSKYIRGYSAYKIQNVSNPDVKKKDEILESVEKFINTQLFKESDIKYSELPQFITEYINGVNGLIETVDNVKRDMTDNDVASEDIGDINEYVDMFMDKLDESFNPTMDRILLASGYITNKRLNNINTEKSKAPVFL